ncbi:MAG: hypothetical protein ABIJ09_11440 [Pseudomonadota bacterium]
MTMRATGLLWSITVPALVLASGSAPRAKPDSSFAAKQVRPPSCIQLAQAFSDPDLDLDEEALPALVLGVDLESRRARRSRRCADDEAKQQDLRRRALHTVHGCAVGARAKKDTAAWRALSSALGVLNLWTEEPERLRWLDTLDVVAPRDLALYWRAQGILDDKLAGLDETNTPGSAAASATRLHLLRQAVATKPDLQGARLAAALELVPEQHPADVLELLRPVPDSFAPPAVATWRGRALLATGATEQAIALFRLALAQEQDEKKARRQARRARRDPRALVDRPAPAKPDADNLVTRFATRHGSPLDVERWQGEALAVSGDLDGALQALLEGHSYEPLARLALAHGRLFEAALAMQLGHSDDHEQQVATLERLGAWSAALSRVRWLKKRRCGERGDADPCELWTRREQQLLPKVRPLQVDPSRAFPGLAQRLARPRIQIWTEKPVPPQIGTSSARPLSIDVLQGDAVVFAAAQGERAVAVVLSRAIDPRGEVSRGGYFAYLRQGDEREPWQGPYYLGFAENYPYVVQNTSRVPVFDQQRLQLEVELRELDDDSITLPPVRLRAKRQQKDLVISCALDELTRDRDGDGLTDLYEEKIATDPARADSDGDGLRDDEDMLPLTPEQRRADAEQEILAQALLRLLGQREGAIVHAPSSQPADLDASLQAMQRSAAESARRDAQARSTSVQARFIETEQPLFSGTLVPVRTVLLPPALATAYDRKFGRTFMLHFGDLVFSPDRRRVFFTYSFGWRGGTFVGDFDGQHWTLREVGSWVT